MQRTHFRLDAAGLGACYDTTAGVGVAGGAAAVGDTGERRKGLNLLWVLPVAAVVIIGIFLSPQIVTRIVAPIWSGKSAPVAGPVAGPPGPVPAGAPAPAPGPAPAPAPLPAVVPAAAPAHPVSAPAGIPAMPEERSVGITGIAYLSGRVHVMLSNGETLTSDDRELEFVGKRWVVIGGRVYRWLKSEGNALQGPSVEVGQHWSTAAGPSASGVVVDAPRSTARALAASRLAR